MGRVKTPKCSSCGEVTKRMYFRNKNSNGDWRFVPIGFLCKSCNESILEVSNLSDNQLSVEEEIHSQMKISEMVLEENPDLLEEE